MGGVYNESNTKIIDKDGKAINTQGAPSLGFGFDTAPSTPLQPAQPRRGCAGLPRRGGRHRRGHGRRAGLRHRRPDLISTNRPKQAFALTGIAKYGDVVRSAARPSPSSSARRPRGCSTARASSTRSPSREGGRARRAARRGDPADPAARAEVAARSGRGPGAEGRDQRGSRSSSSTSCSRSPRSRSSSAPSSSSTRSRSRSRSGRASSRRCGRSAPRAARCSARWSSRRSRSGRSPP